MSYEFKLDFEHAVIEVVYTGEVGFIERKQAVKDGVSLLQNRDYPRILINLVGAKMQLSKEEKLDLAEFISEQHSLIKAKTAFLIRCEQTEREEIDEAVVRSDDFDSKVFYSRTKALDWLGGR